MFKPEEGNIWGIDDAGINNSGMIVLAQTDKLIRLGCSPGISSFDPPDFNALIIEITFRDPSLKTNDEVERPQKGSECDL